MLKRPAIAFLCLAIAAVFVFGVVHLFELRLSQGDVYPPYSTLRTDPLGASVLYESLERLPDMTANRYFEQTFTETNGHGRALFVLGTQASPFSSVASMSRSEFDNVQQFVRKGGRVVVAYYPEVQETWWSRHDRTNDVTSTNAPPKKKSKSKKSKADTAKSTNSVAGTNIVVNTKSSSSTNKAIAKKAKGIDPDDPDDFKNDRRRNYVDLNKEWGFEVTYNNLTKNAAGKIDFPDAERVADDEELPAALPLHTAVCFTNLDKGWTVVYQRDKKTPVVLQRAIGTGSILLMADSYPFSNESMFKERYTSLLIWALGDSRHVLFDEAHLGVTQSPGMASLMRRYHLEGLIFSLLIVAILFVWRNTQSLVPSYSEKESDSGPVVMGRDSASGFINLVRRGVAPSEILNVCFSEWKQSRGRTASVSPQQWRGVEQVISEQAALAPRERNPIEAYRRITEILKRRI